MEFDSLRNLLYVVAAILFIFGIKGLTHPRTAVRGNLLGLAGMILAMIVTLVDGDLMPGWYWWVGGIVLGGLIGVVAAKRVQMTAMPELVALFNGFGGIASMLVAGAVFHETIAKAAERMGVSGESDRDLTYWMGQVIADAGMGDPVQVYLATVISGIIGGLTFTGSVLAFVKLREWISGRPMTNPMLKAGNVVALVGSAIFGAVLLVRPDAWWAYWALAACALVGGIFFVLPIGGADMPVVISLLNSYSGLAAAATGFVINNTVLIVSGSLVGASGLILTKIMCVAMNRSLTNVLFGVMAEVEEGPSADEVYAGKVTATTPDEVAMLFDGVQRVCVVPGYGMAVAQAQHTVRDLANLLEAQDVEVIYGIHPVAGRMPGHMNVLLAEADVPYDQLKEMDEVNAMMEQVDICLVIGANDVVNPDARTNPTSPIAGMPIINVDQARTVVVVKRSLSPGFAGIPNPLFAAPNTLMMFGDGKKALVELIRAIKEN
ncbi:MAG: NAD(P)(+) transhydrogenase (Re/Si-specific) subunit beta [Phycisphaerales bacterium]|nr:NAD(P)(+) transhydrogenase (Re/Si-specific) subunit beta [Phycisphaerae bacterium]NNF44889.1 NAD(P)(+) transhydrogenase (Re/Si-specific) subunit beta [Phycisphaerales bacterium]NNM27103.1 NAD(P)(+) transhydrogenase (Re/Si-specific) subunit beta [Phycisphaerales bacterium]